MMTFKLLTCQTRNQKFNPLEINSNLLLIHPLLWLQYCEGSAYTKVRIVFSDCVLCDLCHRTLSILKQNYGIFLFMIFKFCFPLRDSKMEELQGKGGIKWAKRREGSNEDWESSLIQYLPNFYCVPCSGGTEITKTKGPVLVEPTS